VATAQEVQAVAPARSRPDGLDWVLSVGCLLFFAPLAILAAMLEGFLFGGIEEDGG
jgi:hypothetical protein